MSEESPVARKDFMPPKVTLVGSDQSDDTLRTRRRLESRGIPYEFVDIDETSESVEESSATRKVPQVEICGTIKRLSPPDDDEAARDLPKPARRKVKN